MVGPADPFRSSYETRGTQQSENLIEGTLFNVLLGIE